MLNKTSLTYEFQKRFLGCEIVFPAILLASARVSGGVGNGKAKCVGVVSEQALEYGRFS